MKPILSSPRGLDGLLFFGDNFAGWVVGFDTRRGWRLVGLPSSRTTTDDSLVELVDAAFKALQHLSMDVHYLSCGIFGPGRTLAGRFRKGYRSPA
jgi:hypothetical protein